MRIVGVKFRGEDIDIQIDHDGGYEHDTGAHEVEWHFYGMSGEQQDDLAMTSEEEQAIYNQIYEVLADGDCEDF